MDSFFSPACGLHSEKQKYVLINQYRRDLLVNCEIAASTCSSAASGELKDFVGTFDALIIDEAAQSIEITNLVPLMKHSCRRLVLVGE